MSEPDETEERWPVFKVTMHPEIYAALDAVREPGETIQVALVKIVAKHFGIEPVIRGRGNTSGKKRRKETE